MSVKLDFPKSMFEYTCLTKLNNVQIKHMNSQQLTAQGLLKFEPDKTPAWRGAVGI